MWTRVQVHVKDVQTLLLKPQQNYTPHMNRTNQVPTKDHTQNIREKATRAAHAAVRRPENERYNIEVVTDTDYLLDEASNLI